MCIGVYKNVLYYITNRVLGNPQQVSHLEPPTQNRVRDAAILSLDFFLHFKETTFYAEALETRLVVEHVVPPTGCVKCMFVCLYLCQSFLCVCMFVRRRPTGPLGSLKYRGDSTARLTKQLTIVSLFDFIKATGTAE